MSKKAFFEGTLTGGNLGNSLLLYMLMTLQNIVYLLLRDAQSATHPPFIPPPLISPGEGLPRDQGTVGPLQSDLLPRPRQRHLRWPPVTPSLLPLPWHTTSQRRAFSTNITQTPEPMEKVICSTFQRGKPQQNLLECLSNFGISTQEFGSQSLWITA